jgi:hypothetical protein
VVAFPANLGPVLCAATGPQVWCRADDGARSVVVVTGSAGLDLLAAASATAELVGGVAATR